ncbi:hypothetical protein ACN38_g10688 [Penicillium nordicum]|uniref:Uncharacterized protein n=1 Tax=Penicillium nordicum TaxID=229535 RepID=A0A0M8P158_9EURO|nr:hypothetical protein ACN38_g10688 [Penicillium nordicum]
MANPSTRMYLRNTPYRQHAGTIGHYWTLLIISVNTVAHKDGSSVIPLAFLYRSRVCYRHRLNGLNDGNMVLAFRQYLGMPMRHIAKAAKAAKAANTEPYG